MVARRRDGAEKALREACGGIGCHDGSFHQRERLTSAEIAALHARVPPDLHFRALGTNALDGLSHPCGGIFHTPFEFQAHPYRSSRFARACLQAQNSNAAATMPIVIQLSPDCTCFIISSIFSPNQ